MKTNSIASRIVPLLFTLGLALCVAPASADNFVVDTDGSTNDADLNVAACADVGGHCTLQAAIQQGNVRPGAHTITFTIATVLLQSDLPDIKAPFTINGGSGSVRTVISGNGNLYNCFSLTDSGDMTAGHAWDTSTGVGGADGSVLNNLVIKNCKGDAIVANGHGYIFKDNYIGTDITGTVAAPNSGHGISLSASHVYSQENQTFFNNISSAIALLPQPTTATIPAFASSYKSLALASFLGPVEITGNVISGNALNGIDISSENLGFVLASNNFIGTDLLGHVAIPNGQYGVSLLGSTWGHLIGPNNVISGNLSDGVFDFAGKVTLTNYIMGNRIGVSLADQAADIGNDENGVNVNGTQPEDKAGRSNPTGISLVIGPGNIISDNKLAPSSPDPDVLGSDGAGVVVTGGAATKGVIVRGNTIGLAEFAATPQPTKVYGNAGDGIAVSASGVQIGGTGAGDANVIAGNGRHGILIKGSGSASTLVQGNSIGVHPAIVGNLNLGNGADGIHIDAAILSTIGGSGAGASNTIAGNGRNGVKILNGSSSSGWANLLQRNSIYGNARNVLTPGISIDLDRVEDATNPLGSEHIGNPYSNFDQASPAICTGAGDPAECAGFAASHSGAANTTLDWTIHTHGPASMRIEFFKLDTNDPNTATLMSYIGEQVVTTDASGFPVSAGCTSGRCTASVAGSSAGGYVVATASDITFVDSVAYPFWLTVPAVTCLQGATTCTINNTSEFSNVAQPSIDTTTVVSIVNPAGSGNATSTATSVFGQTVDVTVTVTAGGGSSAPTGTVTITAAGSNCTAMLGNPSSTHSTATCTLTPNLPVAASAYAVTASYPGSGTFNTSSSSGAGNGSLTVNKASTTTTISGHTPDPSIVGTPILVTVNVAVTAPGAGTPSGTITVSDGTSTCTITLPAPSCNLVPITAGVKMLTATYPGDSSFANSASAGVAHTVSNLPATATTTAITIVNPQGNGNVTNTATGVFGQPVSVTVTVTALTGAVAPTGTVTITAGASTCPALLALQAGLVANGTCTLVPALPVAAVAYSVTGAYPGTPSFGPSNSGGAGNGSLTVNKASTTTTISAHTPNPSVVNTAIAVSAGVAVTAPGSGTPTGTITVSDTVSSCVITLPAPSCNLTPTTSGAKTLTAVYSGAANFNTSTSAGVAHTVTPPPPAATSTAVTAVNPASAVFGQTVAVTATVTALAGAVGPSGSVTLNAGGSSCVAVLGAPMALVATGTCNLAPPLTVAVSAYSVTAAFAGNASFSASSSSGAGNGAVTIAKAATTAAITGHTPSPSNVNAPILVTAGVTVTAPGAGTPTGTITISDTVSNCVITLPATTCNLTPTTTGAKNLTATYSGDANFLGAASPIVSHTVSPGGSTVATTAVTTVNPVTIVFGQPVSVTASVTANSGVVGPDGSITISAGGSSCVVALGAPVGLTATGTCSLAPPLPASAVAYTVSAAYSGSATFAAGSSSGAGNGSLTVSKASTTAAIISHLPSPSAAGSPITVTAAVAVTAPGTGTPTGTITISDSIVNCVITLPANSCNLTPNIAGPKTLTATYSGDANYNSSVSPGVAHTVTAGSTVTSTAITLVSPSTTVSGQPVAVTASVTAATGAVAPDGNVTLSAGASSCVAVLGSPVALTSTGTCTLLPAPTTTGSPFTVTSSYPGTAVFAASTSSGAGNGSLAVNKAATTTTISAHTPNPSSVGAPILVTVGVAVTAPGTGTPTGTITVSDGAATCTITLPAPTCNLTPSTAGAKTLTATYAGDGNFIGSASAGVGHTVNIVATTTTVSLVNPATAVFGQPVAVTASVTAASGAVAPTGSVTLTAGASSCTSALGSPAVLTATATCTLAPQLAVAASAYAVSASFAGTPTFAASASSGAGNGSVTVNKAATTATIGAHTPDPSPVNTPISVSASVTVIAPGAGTPTGTITVSDGTVSCVITLPATSCTLTPTVPGTKTLTASYSGDASFAANVSAGTTDTVNPVLTFVGPTPIGGATGTATLSGGGPTCTLVNPAFIPVSPIVPPPGVTFPVGLFDFSTTGCTVGSTITMQIVYNVPLPANTQYWKYGPTPGDPSLHWYVMPGSSVNGSTMTLTITDGQIGDDDLTANGTIVDQGGPGAAPLTIPTLSNLPQIALALVLLLLAALALGRRARRRA